ncbi:MAG: hypothetical protein ABSF21_03560 [Dehalococcoidia bacterium]
MLLELLAFPVLIALALFSFRLILQSRISLVTDEIAKQRLVSRLQKTTLATFIPTGIVMVIVGFTLMGVGLGLISIGFALMGTSIVLWIEGELTKRKGEVALSFAKKVRLRGVLFSCLALAAAIAMIVQLILAILGNGD